MVDEKIPFSLFFLSESQSTTGNDRNIHTHACKYKSISHAFKYVLYKDAQSKQLIP
jgi:hypothetical protein